MGAPAAGDTIVALSSGRPPAAVAIIRTSGPAVRDALRALGGRVPAPRVATLMRLRDPADASPLDDALILHFAAPASATGEDVVEYQCHGGRAVVDRLLALLSAQPGFRLAEPGEFTRRALANGRIDLTEAEGLADLLEAETESQRKAALLMAEGGLRREVEAWRDRLVSLSARAEAAIDYVDDEDETGADSAALAAEAASLADELASWLERPRSEPLREGVRVVLAGPPNAGKSSLINVLTSSERAIVTEIPGTTRDVIEVPVAVQGLPFVLVDTAGLRDSVDRVEQIGVERAGAEARRSDILLWLGASGEGPDHPRRINVHPKADLPALSVADGAIAVSTVTGDGIATLWDHLVGAARGILPDEGRVALNRRQARLLDEAREALTHANPQDVVITAHALRMASDAFDRLSGRAGVEDMLDALFGRFCLGK
jgi:tRNA modification GTPase